MTGAAAIKAAIDGAVLVGGFAVAPRADGRWPTSWRCGANVQARLEAACQQVFRGGVPEACGQIAAALAVLNPLVAAHELADAHVRHALTAAALAAGVPASVIKTALAKPVTDTPEPPTAATTKTVAKSGRRQRPLPRHRELWEAAVPIAGTPAEAWLRSLGLSRFPDDLRFAMLPWLDSDGCARTLDAHPCLLAPVQVATAPLAALHLLWLANDGADLASGLVDSQSRVPLRPVSVIGAWHGGSVRLDAANYATRLAITTTLRHGLHLWGRGADAPVWVVLGPGQLTRLTLPAAVREVAVVVPGPLPPDEINRVVQRLAESGRRARVYDWETLHVR
jgi:hypothetical protein